LIEAAVRQFESKDRPVIVVGNSLGALVAEKTAFQRPDLVHGLVLLDGSIPGGPSNPGFFPLLKLVFSKKWYQSYRDNPDGAWSSLYPYYADLDSLPDDDKNFLKRRVMARVESSTQEEAYFSTQRSLIRAFSLESSWFSTRVQSFKGKILLIWGEKDKIIPLSSTKAFMALRKDIKLEVISGSGHLPQQEKPHETASLMADFAGQVTVNSKI
jgi:pimeloyl-ACP methyl ester carboxylesterase